MENFVYTSNKNGSIKAGGYNITNKLLENTLSGGGALTNMLVPAGLFLSKKMLETGNGLKFKTEDNNEVIDDDLYSKLLKLAQPDSKTKSTRTTRRKKKRAKNKMTRRMR